MVKRELWGRCVYCGVPFRLAGCQMRHEGLVIVSCPFIYCLMSQDRSRMQTWLAPRT